MALRDPGGRRRRRLRGWLPWIIVGLAIGLRVQSLDHDDQRDQPTDSGAALGHTTVEMPASGPAEIRETQATIEATVPVEPSERLTVAVETPATETSGPPTSVGGAGRSEPGRALDAVGILCDRIAARLASVSFEDCNNTGFTAEAGSSVAGRPLLVREVSAASPAGSLGRVLLIGGIHGDELSSVSIVFRWNRLLQSQGSGPFDWRIIPALNPDGLLTAEASRLNANGVDLNRNFPTPDWQQATHDYWIRRTSRNPRRYPGESALSEPESRWLAQQIETFRPEVIISVHAPHGVLDFDGPPRAPERLGSLPLQPIGTYPGSLGRYAGIQSGLRVVTIELASAGTMPPPDEQKAIWDDLVRWLEERFLVDTNRDAALLAGSRATAGS